MQQAMQQLLLQCVVSTAYIPNWGLFQQLVMPAATTPCVINAAMHLHGAVWSLAVGAQLLLLLLLAIVCLHQGPKQCTCT